MQSYPPEDLIEYKRDRLRYKQHLNRLREIHPTLKIEAPSCMSLKHLSTRAKKKQLIEDRHQALANENRKLMEKMTAVSLLFPVYSDIFQNNLSLDNG